MQDFTIKRAALFACLDDASVELKGTALDQSGQISTLSVLTRNTPKRKESITYLRGKESLFKKPELPLARCLKPRKMPDYQMNPHKWKKYSLSDVDISDRTNTAAAFTFLKQMDDQQEDAIAELNAANRYAEQSTKSSSSNSNCDVKIEFKRSSKIRRDLKALTANEVADVEVDKPQLRGSKLIMPEYVIGQKSTAGGSQRHRKPKGNEGKVVEHASSRKLTLSHLQDDDDDNDE